MINEIKSTKLKKIQIVVGFGFYSKYQINFLSNNELWNQIL